MSAAAENREHPIPTHSGKRYLFTAKHHGMDKEAAQWLPSLSDEEEFSIFDTADSHQISDDREWLYGVLRAETGGLRDVGTWRQQVAEFPVAGANVPWHGYPIWALSAEALPSRAGQKMRPSKEVFQKLESAGLIDAKQRLKRYRGKHV